MRHTRSKPKLSHALSGMFTSVRTTSSLRNDLGEDSAKERGGKSGIIRGIGSINGNSKRRTPFLPRTISRVKIKSGKMSVGFDISRPDIEKRSGVDDEEEEDRRQDDIESSHSDLDGEGVDGSHSPLHEACRCHPPSSLVRRLIEDDPRSVQSVNSRGQTPLHVAAAYGASPRVVEILTNEYPDAASQTDDADRTPLHLACQKCTRERWCDTGLTDDDGYGCGRGRYSRNEGDGRDDDEEDKRDSDKTAATSITESGRDTTGDLSAPPVRISRRRTDGNLVRGPLLRVVRILLNAAPDSVHAEDDRGMTPLEHAINNGASVKVVKALHRASGVQWRKEHRSKVQRVSGVVLRTIGKALLIRKGAKTGASSEAPDGVGTVPVGSDGRRLGRISRKTKSCSPNCYPRSGSGRPRKSNLPERKNRFSVW